MEFENGERCFRLLFHFLRNVTDCGLDKIMLEVNICTFVVLFQLSDFDAEVLVEGPVSSGVLEGKYCIEIGATVSVPRITGRQENSNNAASVNPESNYRVNVATYLL